MLLGVSQFRLPIGDRLLRALLGKIVLVDTSVIRAPRKVQDLDLRVEVGHIAVTHVELRGPSTACIALARRVGLWKPKTFAAYFGRELLETQSLKPLTEDFVEELLKLVRF